MSEIDKIVAEYFEVVDGRICPDWRSITEQELRSALIRAAEGRWVKVSERLPTHNYSVLGCVVSGGLIIGPDDRMVDKVSYLPEEGIWLQFVGEVSGHIGNMHNESDAIVQVSHWQDQPDLPTPPTD